jgi:hypothetical protein
VTTPAGPTGDWHDEDEAEDVWADSPCSWPIEDDEESEDDEDDEMQTV